MSSFKNTLISYKMAQPLRESAQLSPGSFPAQVSEKTYKGLCQQKRWGSREAENSTWDRGMHGSVTFLDCLCWCQGMLIQRVCEIMPLACGFTAAEEWKWNSSYSTLTHRPLATDRYILICTVQLKLDLGQRNLLHREFYIEVSVCTGRNAWKYKKWDWL